MADTGLLRTPARQERTRQSEERILDVVEMLLDDGENFDEVNVEEIARRAGVATRTVYHRFPNKSAILMHLWVTRISGKMIQRALDALDPEFCDGKSVREIVFSHLRGAMENFHQYRKVTMLVGREVRFGSPSEEVVRGNQQMGRRTRDYLLARLYEHKDVIGHPDLQESIELADMCTTLCIREWSYAQGTNVLFDIDGENETKFLNNLADVFVRFLMVEGAGHFGCVNGKEGDNGG